MVNKKTAIHPRPLLVGNVCNPSEGVTLHFPTPTGIIGSRFQELRLDRAPTDNVKYDGFLLLTYKWKEKKGEERDEDTIFLGIRGLHWPSICLDHGLLKKFLDELISLHSKERGYVILSYKYKTFRNLTMDRTGQEFKVKNNKRAECLVNREVVKDTQATQFKLFPFIPRGSFSVNAERCSDIIRTYFINHTRFADI